MAVAPPASPAYIPAMRYLLLLPAVLLAACAFGRQYEQNPDLNHTHADFAIWVDDEKLDFSANELMSGISTDEATHDEEGEHLHPYLHLHDNIGYVLHRHKPGLTLAEFFASMQVAFTEKCYVSLMPLADGEICSESPFRLFVRNMADAEPQWKELPFDTAYEFRDMDQVLITTAATDAQLTVQMEQMTDDACRYSRTCPWRGDPPTENCIADPAVPCVAPADEEY